MTEPKFVYVTYIATTPEKLWQALTEGAFTRQYWFGQTIESDWTLGSRVVFRSGSDVHDYGEVLACEPGSKVHAAVSNGWPLVLASLKSLLETGRGSTLTTPDKLCGAKERAIAL